ncbi:hypothetical protein DB347_08790 [Opitutaceae bacterium EW11]|nr:hypothetical protein DB347_08790 [Opitutaceae bacterium EW11]
MRFFTPWIGGALISLFLFRFMPSLVVAMNDDFGYLRSVVATLQRGRPWTDDWLEPWAYSMSAVSAFLFRVSGSFYLSTSGLLAVLGGISTLLVSRLWTERRIPSAFSVLLAIFLTAFPTVLWKSVEYSALALYIPCLLGMLLSAERRKWLPAGLFWAVAVASRQSAIVWLAIPGAELIASLKRRQKGQSWLLAAMLGGCLVWFAALLLLSNRTHAQQVITSQLGSHIGIGSLRHASVGLVYLLVAIGLGCTVSTFFSPRPSLPPTSRWFGSLRWGFVAAVALAAIWPRLLSVEVEHSGYDGALAGPGLRMLVLISALGLAVFRGKFRAGYLAAAVASVCLFSVRDAIYDYYLIDAVILGLFSRCTADISEMGPDAAPQAIRSWIVAAAFTGIMLAVQIGASVRLKEFVDFRAAACDLFERSLRAGEAKTTELADAPFGFIAWYWYPYYIGHEGRRSPALDGFGMYLAPKQVSLLVNPTETELARSGFTQIRSEIYPFGWGRSARFVLVRRGEAGNASVPVDWQEYRPESFPLGDAEWARLIEAPVRQ